MDRRIFLMAGAGLGLYLATRGNGPPLSADGAKVLVYVGAPDCGACVAYERTDRAGFKAKVRAKGWAYREAIAPSLGRLHESGYWPVDLRWAERQATGVRGTPTFLLFDGGTLVRTAFGWGEASRVLVPLVG